MFAIMDYSSIPLYVHINIQAFFLGNFELPFKLITLSIPPHNYTDFIVVVMGYSKFVLCEHNLTGTLSNYSS